MQKAIKIFLIICSSISAAAQTNVEKFQQYNKAKDTVSINKLFAAWEKKSSTDADYYATAFSYYFSKSQTEIISLDRDYKSKQALVLTDSTGKEAGFMNVVPGFNPAMLEKAFYFGNTGIEKFPNRLDIRFGKSYALQQLKEYDKFTAELIKTLHHSKTISNNWLWTNNKKVEDGETMMLESYQTYLSELYDTGDDNLLENMKQIGDVVIQYYPNNIKILSTTAVAYLITKDYDKAIIYLKQAEKVDPKDFIVLNNIAQAYIRKGDKENAIKYLELTAKYGDAQATAEAKAKIKELKK